MCESAWCHPAPCPSPPISLLRRRRVVGATQHGQGIIRLLSLLRRRIPYRPAALTPCTETGRFPPGGVDGPWERAVLPCRPLSLRTTPRPNGTVVTAPAA